MIAINHGGDSYAPAASNGDVTGTEADDKAGNKQLDSPKRADGGADSGPATPSTECWCGMPLAKGACYFWHHIVAVGIATPSIRGTVVRKNPHAFAFRFGHDGVWTKWPSPKNKGAWT